MAGEELATPSVADLVEPLVTNADAVPADVRAEATRLVELHAVSLGVFGPLLVTAVVRDGDEVSEVRLASTQEGLSSTCTCPFGMTGMLCPHSLAAAIETWHRGAKR